MITDIKVILKKWDEKISNGEPDMDNQQHRFILSSVLNELQWDSESIQEFFYKYRNKNLFEQKLTKVGLQKRIAGASSKLSAPSNASRVANDGDISDSDFISILKKEFDINDVKVLKPLSGQNKSSKFNMFTFDYDNNSYEIILAGKVSGRGTAQTTDQELAFLLMLSAIHSGANSNDKEEFLSMMMDSQVYEKVYDGSKLSESQAIGLVAWLENNESWYTSTLSQTSKLAGMIGTPKRYEKDSSKLDINVLAKKLYQDEYNQKLDLDKWNPADVWLYYDNSAPNSEKLAELNNYLLDSVKNSKGIIGISLKKGSGSVSIVNDGKQKEYKLDTLGLKIGGLFSITSYLEFSGKNLDGLGLTFRIFQGSAKEQIRGEATTKGADAVQGKVALPVIDIVSGQKLSSKIRAVGGEDILNYDKKTKEFSFSKNGIKKYNVVKRLWDKLKSKVNYARGAKKSDYATAFSSKEDFLSELNKKNLAENKAKAVLNSRFQTIALLSFLGTMNKKKQSEVAIGLLKYGKSQSVWSAPHMKVQ
jgi:hypothetical protein